MGTEIVFLLIYPVVLISVAAAGWFWLAVAKAEHGLPLGYIRAYLPLVLGFAISMAGLAIFAYVDTVENLSWLVEHGLYTESQRAEYLPQRVVGQVILRLVFVLPAICFLVVRCTVRLVKARRLTLVAIGLRTVIAWVVLSLVIWLWNLAAITPPETLLYFLEATIVPVLIYGLPIPLTALYFFRGRMVR